MFKHLCKVEESVRGCLPEEIVRQRKNLSKPLIETLKDLLDSNRLNWENDSEIVRAMDYMLTKWPHFNGFLEVGVIAIDNNLVERIIRHLAKVRKSWNYAGSSEWADYACKIHTMLQMAVLNGNSAKAWLLRFTNDYPDAEPKDRYKFLPYHRVPDGGGDDSSPANI